MRGAGDMPMGKGKDEVNFAKLHSVIDDKQNVIADAYEDKSIGICKLKVFRIDPEIVLDNITINPNNRYSSYFGASFKVQRFKSITGF